MTALLALSRLQTLGLFVGLPFGVLALIFVVISTPSWVREGRYRPGLAWAGEPVWFNGPAVGSDPPPDASTKVGGASAAW